MKKFGVIARLLLYFSIAEASAVINEFSVMTPEKLMSMIWTDWLVLGTKILMPGLITIKAFMNTSISELSEHSDIKVEPEVHTTESAPIVING